MDNVITDYELIENRAMTPEEFAEITGFLDDAGIKLIRHDMIDILCDDVDRIVRAIRANNRGDLWAAATYMSNLICLSGTQQAWGTFINKCLDKISD